MNEPDPDTLAELNVSRETLGRLQVFGALLEKWTPRINLVSRASLADFWTRHISDSIQVFNSAPACDHWVDIGSGGGFPGLVAAIMAVETRPGCRFTLIESDQRKSAFLRTVIRETQVNARVLAERIEKAPPQQADVLSARALADLTQLLMYAQQHLAEGGTALFPKGVTWQKELSDARDRWRFDVEVIESNTQPEAAILKIKGATRV